MPIYNFETYDVFTETKFTGNQLAVVANAEGLTTEDMQAITREFNLAETSFILPAENPENTARVRIFTTSYEMPFAGHPTVGTTVAIARARNLKGEIKLELNAGLFPVRVETDGDKGFAEFQNPNLPKETGEAPAADKLEAALSLPQGSIDRAHYKPRRIGAGVDFVYVHAPLQVVREASLDIAAWRALDMNNIIGVYLYAKDGEAADATYHSRMFGPDAGVPEDPATGSAAAAFPGHVALSERLTDGTHHWIIEQGFEMGRPSRIQATVDIDAGAVSAVRIGGAAVKVQEGRLFL